MASRSNIAYRRAEALKAIESAFDGNIFSSIPAVRDPEMRIALQLEAIADKLQVGQKQAKHEQATESSDEVIFTMIDSKGNELNVTADDTANSLEKRYNKTPLLEMAKKVKADAADDNNKNEIAKKIIDSIK